MRMILQHQMNIKKQKEDMIVSDVKGNYATHFGPEETPEMI